MKRAPTTSAATMILVKNIHIMITQGILQQSKKLIENNPFMTAENNLQNIRIPINPDKDYSRRL